MQEKVDRYFRYSLMGFFIFYGIIKYGIIKSPFSQQKMSPDKAKTTLMSISFLLKDMKEIYAANGEWNALAMPSSTMTLDQKREQLSNIRVKMHRLQVDLDKIETTLINIQSRYADVELRKFIDLSKLLFEYCGEMAAVIASENNVYDTTLLNQLNNRMYKDIRFLMIKILITWQLMWILSEEEQESVKIHFASIFKKEIDTYTEKQSLNVDNGHDPLHDMEFYEVPIILACLNVGVFDKPIVSEK